MDTIQSRLSCNTLSLPLLSGYIAPQPIFTCQCGGRVNRLIVPCRLLFQPRSRPVQPGIRPGTNAS